MLFEQGETMGETAFGSLDVPANAAGIAPAYGEADFCFVFLRCPEKMRTHLENHPVVHVH